MSIIIWIRGSFTLYGDIDEKEKIGKVIVYKDFSGMKEKVFMIRRSMGVMKKENKREEKEKLIKFALNQDFGGSSWGDITIPFEITPEDFLRFARSDLETKERKSYVNALSNVKRAIESQIDSILFIIGYLNTSKKQKWNFPKKIDFIKSLGVVSPQILKRINKVRNLLEHEYKYPSKDNVENSIDVAELFLNATERVVLQIDFFELYTESEDAVILRYNREKHLFKIEPLDDLRKAVIVEENDPNFMPLLKKYVEFVKGAGT